MGQLTAGKGGNAPIDDAFSRLQTPTVGLIDLLLPARERQSTLLFEGAHPLARVNPFKGACCA